MGEIIDVDAFMAARNPTPENNEPCFTITASDGVHVIPVIVFMKIANGDMRIDELEKWDVILPSVIGDWLNRVRSNIPNIT
jgi:hypothetical protein